MKTVSFSKRDNLRITYQSTWLAFRCDSHQPVTSALLGNLGNLGDVHGNLGDVHCIITFSLGVKKLEVTNCDLQ